MVLEVPVESDTRTGIALTRSLIVPLSMPMRRSAMSDLIALISS